METTPSDSTPTPTVRSKTKAEAVVDIEISLDDWMNERTPTLGRKVEAINAFYRQRQRRGLVRAARAAFDADFEVFLKQPA